MSESIPQLIEVHGYAICPSIFDDSQVLSLVDATSSILKDCPAAGIRGLTQKIPVIQSLSRSTQIMNLVNPILGANAKLIRSILFNKSPSVNWQVNWHQDLTIAVQQRIDIPGFNTWSIKGCIPHVQPPESILAQMLTVRIHLDPADTGNGALRVAPGSHHQGRIATAEAGDAARACGEYICEVQAGDVLLFRPLILHASHKALSPKTRRIIHLEYTSAQLPNPLQWSELA